MCMVHVDTCPWRSLFGPRMNSYIKVCLNVLISVHYEHLMCSSTSLQYPGHQACNLNLLCVAVTPPWISYTLLIMSFLKMLGGTIASALYMMPFSTFSLYRGISSIHSFLSVQVFRLVSTLVRFLGWVFGKTVRLHPLYNSILRVFMFLSIFTLKS